LSVLVIISGCFVYLPASPSGFFPEIKSSERCDAIPYLDDYYFKFIGGIQHMSAELKQKLQELKDRILALKEHL